MRNLYIFLLLITTISSCVKDLPKKNPLHELPIISTVELNEMTPYSFRVYSEIESYANAEIIEKGFCWSKDTLPIFLDFSTSSTISYYNVNQFVSTIKEFDQGTNYHIRAYVKTKDRVAYGNDLRIKTNGYSSVLKDIDGNQYKTVVIGQQEWMGENLKVTKYNDGTLISNITDNTKWSQSKTGSWCYYDNDITKNSKYGKLYNGYVINNKQVCPVGWHIPSESDWNELSNYVYKMNEGIIADKLKEDGSNPHFFSALNGGLRTYTGGFYYLSSDGYWWDNSGYGIQIRSVNDLQHLYTDINQGYSIRCIKD